MATAVGRSTVKPHKPGLRDYYARPLWRMDFGLIVAVLSLVGFGLMMVYSSSLVVSMRDEAPPAAYFQVQLLAVALGLLAIVAIQFFHYHIVRRYSTRAMLGILAVLTGLLFFGQASLGARRGLFGGSIQPSEIAKLLTVFYVADWLSSKGDRIRGFKLGVLPFLAVVGLVSGLIAVQPDLSTAILVVLVAFTMFFVAGGRWFHFIVILVIGVAVFAFAISYVPHAAERWHEYQVMIQDPGQADFQVRQTFYALARGGLFGQGLGKSFQKTGPLPVPHTDGILAVIGEEIGLAGCLLMLALIVYLAIRGYKIVLETKDAYGQLLALGIVSWLLYQALINAAVTAGVIPVTGMPFPFLSYGGTSMAISLTAVGVLLNISQQNKRLEAGLTRSKGLKRDAVVGVGRRNRRTHLPRSRYHS